MDREKEIANIKVLIGAFESPHIKTIAFVNVKDTTIGLDPELIAIIKHNLRHYLYSFIEEEGNVEKIN